MSYFFDLKKESNAKKREVPHIDCTKENHIFYE